jgi:hypothetical protein
MHPDLMWEELSGSILKGVVRMPAITRKHVNPLKIVRIDSVVLLNWTG